MRVRASSHTPIQNSVMSKPKRECGSCAHWIKWKHPSQNGCGLCYLLDLAGPAQNGKGCSYWAGKKYKRPHSSAAERQLGKLEVVSSILTVGFIR